MKPDTHDSAGDAETPGSPGAFKTPEDASSTDDSHRQGVMTRRRAMKSLGGTAAFAAAAGVGVVAGRHGTTAESGGSAMTVGSGATVAFFGQHQAGIVTPTQDRLHFAAFDLHDGASIDDLRSLLTQWTAASARMTAGLDVGSGAVTGDPATPPDDTGEAYGLSPARLTITVGFGTTLFVDAKGRDRFGLAARRPPQLTDLPAFPGDALVGAQSDGDLCLQACSDDPLVAVHAIRNLARIGRGVVSVRYSQLGFGRTSSTSTAQNTPRNMMGFKDGTANLKAEDGAVMDAHVWAQAGDGPAWMTGGSYLVTRRIRMLIEPWDSTPLKEQERVIGRDKKVGAPLGAHAEFDTPNLTARNNAGDLVIDKKAHVRLAHSSNNGGAVLLRRGYSFTDGTDDLGRLDAGLFFMAYQRDPRAQFVPIQRSLSGKFNDALNEYIQHVGSGLFACPPGATPGHYLGEGLFT